MLLCHLWVPRALLPAKTQPRVPWQRGRALGSFLQPVPDSGASSGEPGAR